MPWKVFKDSETGRFCVHKLKADGTQGERVPGGCHRSRGEATRHLRALYRNVKEFHEFGGSIDDFLQRVRAAFEAQFPNGLEMEDGTRQWLWVADVFEDYIVVKAGHRYFEVGMEVTDDAVTFEPREDWTPVELSYVAVLEMGSFRDVMFVTEFRGKYPDVPIAEGVDVDALVEGDDDPVFVTLPIGKVNALSANKRFYDEAFVAELERQVIANKPVGLMGHLRPDQRATEFPAEAVHWVGARRVGELLWGKGYVPKGEARERLQRYKATKKQIATSIDAVAEGVWDEALGAYRMKADSLKLAQIDIAPADRAGIADLAAVPHFTSEMAATTFGENHQEDSMADKLQIIRELTAEDAKLLPEPVRAAVLATVQTPAEVAQVAEIRQTLGLDDKADVVKTIAEMKQRQEEQRAKDVANHIRVLAADPEKGIKLDAVRGLVVELVMARTPKTVEEAETVYQQVIESDAVKAALHTHVQETMGPRQGTPVQPAREQAKYFPIPADA